MKIITNNVPRLLEAPDHHGGVGEYVRYKNHNYDLGDFVAAIPEAFGTDGWDGYLSDSFYSGILIKFTDDPDYVIMGRYFT